MTPAELLQKYGVNTTPKVNDVVSETTEATKRKIQEIIAKPSVSRPVLPQVKPAPVSPNPKKVVPSSKFSSGPKQKRKYTKRAMKTADENSDIIPARILALFQKPSPPIYTTVFCVRFATQMMASLFSQKYPNSTLKTDNFSYDVHLPVYENISEIVKQAKSMDTIDYHLYKAVL